MVQNISQKSATSAQDFCERYPVEKTQPRIHQTLACECIKFRTVTYDSTPYDSDAWPYLTPPIP